MKFYACAPAAVALSALLLAGCVSPPTGPDVTALPGTGKSYEQFANDDASCQIYARNNLGRASQRANDSAVNTAVGGTLIGAAGGALLGAASGHAGPGALIGAGSGLLIGSAMGNGSSMQSNDDIQRRYNSVYVQCMYAKGNKVPMPAGYVAPTTFEEVPPDYNEQGGTNVPPDYTPSHESGMPPDYTP